MTGSAIDTTWHTRPDFSKVHASWCRIPEMTELSPNKDIIAELDIGALQADGDHLVFAWEDELGRPREGFVVRFRDTFLVYENLCPHWAVPLVFDDDIHLDGMSIVCPMHGARFDIETGECTIGPCEGDTLRFFESELHDTVLQVFRRKKLLIENLSLKRS